jgi:hypothetical protein
VGLGPVGHGFGNAAFPAGLPPAGASFPQQLGATVRGGAIPGYHNTGHRGQAYPMIVPVFAGGYYPPPQAPTQITVINQAPPAPTVIINQNYVPDRANPVMREYTGDSPETFRSYQAPIPDVPEPEKSSGGKPTIYLIAFKDGAVYSSYAYWVEEGTLHYITTSHSHNKASLDLIDRTLSSQLNQERKVEFAIPQ